MGSNSLLPTRESISLASLMCSAFALRTSNGMETFQRMRMWAASLLIGCAHLPELQSVGVDVFECNLLLLLDRFLESADSLSTRNLEREGLTKIIALDPTKELEHATS